MEGALYMKQITISDMTPRQAEAGSLSFKNRLELVRELEQLVQ